VSHRSTARMIAVAAVLANLVAIATNVVVATAGGLPANLTLVPVGLFGIGVVVWSWRKYGRWLPERSDET
jgi:hypothetical protein